MKAFIVIIVFAILLAFISFLLKRSKKPSQANIEANIYERRDDFFTKAERSFFGVLQQTFEPHYRIFGKVRLADIIKVKSGLSQSTRQSMLNKITNKHIDFIVCDSKTLAVICAIELDDSSHQKEDRKHRDDFVDHAFQLAEIPIIHFPVRQAYTLDDIREALKSVLETPNVIKEEIKSETFPSLEKKDKDHENTPQSCPKCGSSLVLKVAKQGKYKGEEFLACSNYPVCKTIIPMRLSA